MSHPFTVFLQGIHAPPKIKLLFVAALVALASPIALIVIDTNQRGSTARNTFKTERIDTFTSTIDVDQRGQAMVTESFVHDFKDEPRDYFMRSLQRSLPIGGYLSQSREIDFLPVLRNGIAEESRTTNTNNETLLRIGNDQNSLTGKQRYTIPYTIKHAVLQDSNAQHIRLSPTDTTFDRNIDATSVTLRSPAAPISADCYVATSIDAATQYPCRAKIQDATVTFQAVRWLEDNEGMYIDVSYPLGTFANALIIQPTPIIPLWAIIVALHVALMSAIWFIAGRDAYGRRTVVPSEELITEVKPYEAGALLSQRPTYASFVGMLLDVAERKAIRFERFEGGGYLSMSVERVQGNHQLDAIEGAVLKRLFQYPTSPDSDKEEAGIATFGKYAEETRLAYRRFETLVYQHLVQRGWYAESILSIQLLSACILAGWTASLYLLLQFRVNDPQLHYLQVQLVLLLPFIYFMPHLTVKGALLRERVQGLAWYIRVAEKERLAFHESPQAFTLKPGKLLAYSAALGLQKDWQKQFLQGYGKGKKS